ncbi:ribonuclease Z [Histomonas meleagridis]|uniref:ribonuclease Z n=1 Tax=Histomonas meleagridis TaxID=135588 RepID=UPI003559DBB0|nr:ribonuclease Z [Histomonas meleagridis]KAH0802425.1 ribonuclease Z [Histomonas meleagridis]
MESSSTIKLACLGTLGFHDSEKGRTACYMIPELGIVFDCGSGLFRVMKNLRTKEIDIFLSHSHVDHVAGLPVLLEVFEVGHIEKIRFHSEKDILNAAKSLLERPYFPVHVEIEYIPFEDNKPIELPNGCKVTYFKLNHTDPCYGYRVERSDISFAYITDTTSNEESEYIKDVVGVKVLAHEMYCNQSQHEIAPHIGHTSTLGLKQFVDKVKPEKVIAIHHNPNGDLESIEKEGHEMIPNLVFAKDNLEIDI